MTYSKFKIYISYSQLCVFVSSLDQPFNDWSDRNFSQGFSWRPGSVSFRALEDAGNHDIHLYINEQISKVDTKCIRAFQVPFEASDNEIEIGSISSSKLIQIKPGHYSLQVEFYEARGDCLPVVIVRLNTGDADFLILQSDQEIIADGEFDLLAHPAG